MKNVLWLNMVFILLYLIPFSGCSTGVESSPDPGIIRVILKSSESDTLLVILGDTVKFSRVDHFDVIVGQGRLYQGIHYSDLYNGLNINRVSTDTVNLLQRSWLDGQVITSTDTVFDVEVSKSKYVGHTVFEWYVPEGVYDKLQFSLNGIDLFIARPRQFSNPLQLADSVSPIMNFNQPITVNAGRITEVDLVAFPLQSVRRFKDSYIFDRKVNIARIQNY